MSIDFKGKSVDFRDLLNEALSEEGSICEAYFAFHNYSIGNKFLAYWQCRDRGIPVGPLATFNKWKSRNRKVKKGQKGIAMLMPIQRKYKSKDKQTGEEKERQYMQFVLKRMWFCLSQTDGDDYQMPEVPTYDFDKALSELDIETVDFDLQNGNCLGFARKRQIAISPLCPTPHKTYFHEVAHVLLGHTDEGERKDGKELPRDIAEVEAECVAYLCIKLLGLDGEEFSRGYIQNWLKDQEIPEKSVKAIFKTADVILKAGGEKVAA